MRQASGVRPIFSDRLHLWAGFECTLARVHDRFRDQIRDTGHAWRIADLDRVAELGIRTLRYPVLWDSIAPDHPDRCDWSWHDERLARLRRLGIRPIAGLVHHGSGPRYTDLLDPDFPPMLARHAARVAERYPWIDLYTPINEPLTTARFSGLYGYWYPHRRGERDFLRMLVTQCKATVLAMQAIRRVVPAAGLVQTEDISRVFSTPALADQADYENGRRWLSLDLLHGRVDAGHPWHRRLLDSGVAPDDLALLTGGGGRPDLDGLNYYPTSERYLDEHLASYPASAIGGNGRRRYADVAALRIAALDGATGLEARVTEAWERYRAPLAITEVHLGGHREEQLRWLRAAWRGAGRLRASGVPVAAVTLWSLVGSMDWNSLLLADAGHYEPGAFDVGGGAPRLTALGRAARSIATAGDFDHPVLDVAGWWRRDVRHDGRARTPAAVLAPGARRLLVVCEPGPTAAALAALCDDRGIAHVVCAGAAEALALLPPGSDRVWAVVAAGTLGSGDGLGVLRRLAAACASRGLPLAYLSRGAAGPAEQRVAAACPAVLVVRDERPGGEDAAVAGAILGRALDLLIDGESGLWPAARPAFAGGGTDRGSPGTHPAAASPANRPSAGAGLADACDLGACDAGALEAEPGAS